MKKHHMVGIGMIISLFGLATVWAAPSVPQTVNPVAVNISVDREVMTDKGILINGEVYVPLKPLSNQNKLSYWLDNQSQTVYLFFGGSGNLDRYQSMPDAIKYKSRTELAAQIMGGIPYEADDYHSGMMKQDIININSLIKALLETNSQINNAIYSKLNLNREPNIDLLRQGFYFRSEPLKLMEDRMEALAEELGDQLSSRDRRKMNDVIDLVEQAIDDKDDAFAAMEDWIKYSNEEDLDDVKDKEKDAKENLYEAVEILTGEDLSKPGKVYSDSLKQRVEKWIFNNAKSN